MIAIDDRIDRAWQRGLIPDGMYSPIIYHAASCASWRGGSCGCNPDVVLETADGDKIPIDLDGNLVSPQRGNG